MSLLTNMTIERTAANIESGSSGSGGYRYLGGTGVNVDNENYQITAKIDNHTICADENGNLQVTPYLYQAGNNINITASDDGFFTISSEMFQSQFQEGDRERYEIAIAQLPALTLRAVTNSTNISNLTDDLSALTPRVTTLEGRADDADTDRSDTKDRVASLEERADTDEAAITENNRLITVLRADFTPETIKLATAIDNIAKLREDVDGQADFLDNLTGLESTSGSLGTQIREINSKIDTLNSIIIANPEADTLQERMDTAESDIDSLEDIVSTGDNNHTDAISRLNTEVNSISGMVGVLSSRFDTFERNTNVTTIRSDIQAIQDAVSTIQINVDTAIQMAESATNSAESFARSIDTIQESLNTHISESDSSIQQLSTDISGLDTRVTPLESLPDRVQAVETSLSEFSSGIQDLNQTAQSNSSSIATLSTKVTTAESSILDLQSTSNSLQNSTFKSLSYLSTLSDSAEVTYTEIGADTAYDPSVIYLFKDADTYSPVYFSSLLTYNGVSDYDPSKHYYFSDGDNFERFVYDAESWEETVENEDIYYYDTEEAIPLFIMSDSQYEEADVSEDGPDPSVTYYTKDSATYSDVFTPEWIKVAEDAEYDQDTPYYSKSVRGKYTRVYEGVDMNDIDDNEWSDRKSEGLYTVGNWSASVTEGLYTMSHDAEDEIVTVESVPANYIIIADSGFANDVVVYIDGEEVLNSRNRSASNHIVTFPVREGSTLMIRTPSFIGGSSVHGKIQYCSFSYY